MKRLIEKAARRTKRKRRIRGRVSGSTARPRLTVFRSNRNVYVQAIDDSDGRTLASASTLAGGTKGLKATVADAERVGQEIAERLKAQSIEEVVFDRNGYLFHGVVKSLADGARKGGLKF